MGTTLTGTTPQDTYDSLIKVTDNGPLSATAKYLSDGLGNDSALALSTSAAGIGTSAPAANLHIASAADTGIRIQAGASSLSYIDLADTASGTPAGSIAYNHITNAIVFNGGGTNTEFARITSAGIVGIGTNAPAPYSFNDDAKLVVANTAGNSTISIVSGTASIGYLAFADGTSGNDRFVGSINYLHSSNVMTFQTNATERFAITANGVTFNGDTAAANALDDYEEGTWTMGVSFGGASVGVTYALNTGKYTKIGRQVVVTGYIAMSSKGSSTGNAQITGLPFTIPVAVSSFSPATLWLKTISFANQYQAYGDTNATTISLFESTLVGTISSLTDADFANSSELMVSLTYFV